MKGSQLTSLLRNFFGKAKGRILTRNDGSSLSPKKNIKGQCKECTQTELTCYHSVTCDHNNQLFWEANGGSSLYPISIHILNKPIQKERRPWNCGEVQDPRCRVVQRLNQFFLLARSISVAIDPLFFYVLAVSQEQGCVYVDGMLAAVVTLLRTGFDAVHLFQIGLQLKLAYISKESLILGSGSLVWDASEIAFHYLRPGGGFWFDIFVILPIPQVTLWILVPYIITSGGLGSVTTVLSIAFVCQFIPKVVHLIFLARSIRRVIGFVFGAVWWGFALNLTAYLVAGHVAGALWYLLTCQRVIVCLLEQLKEGGSGSVKLLGCTQPIIYHDFSLVKAASSSMNQTSLSLCFTRNDMQDYYGIFQAAIPLITGHTWSTKLLYPLFWGLMTLSSFGNALQPSDHTLEVLFSVGVITCGLILFSLLIGNIQVFLHSITDKKEAMKLRLRDLERWMRRRQLPLRLRHRVRRYEHHRWAATRGVDDADMIDCLPEGLRRDVKQHLSLNLVRQVPLFECMDNLVLKNICERLKPHLYVKDELIIREGDPVNRMLFIVRGHLLSTHALKNGDSSLCVLGPGNFCGDELLTWCLRRPFVERLPPSFATLTSVDVTEAFGLEAQDFKFVTEHFRYKFINENLKRTARHYSLGWRTWAAVSIQLAWRRYQAKKAKRPKAVVVEPVEIARSVSQRDPVRLYAAMFSSHKPQDNLQ